MQFTDDGFLGHRLQILQPKKGGFRAGVDSVFLAAAIPAQAGDQVLEAGIGPGVAACCLQWRVPGLSFIGVEKEAESASLAAQNLARNGMTGRIITADFTTELPLAGNTFDHAFANPPWFAQTNHTLSPHGLKARAHAGPAETLADWVKNFAKLLKQGASLSMILPAADEPRAIATFIEHGFGDIRILPICPRQDTPAIRIIIQARNNLAPASLRLDAFILHGQGNEFTAQAQAILREGKALQPSS